MKKKTYAWLAFLIFLISEVPFPAWTDTGSIEPGS